jgi:hypothetical protein
MLTVNLEYFAVCIEYFAVSTEYLADITTVVAILSEASSHDPYVDRLELRVA